MKYVLIVLALSGCAGTPPMQKLKFKDQIVFVDTRAICSASDGAKLIVWSCK